MTQCLPARDPGLEEASWAEVNSILGITGPRIKVQVKRTDGRIPVKDIRSFLAVLSDGDVGLFVALGGFTQDAENESRHQKKRRVMLVDLRKLFDMWIEHYARIPDAERALLPLRAIWFFSPGDAG